MQNEIFDNLSKFESALIQAWTYDTRLDWQQDCVSSSQLKKCDEYHAKVRFLKEALIASLKEIVDAKPC